jgi:hypothetical protein
MSLALIVDGTILKYRFRQSLDDQSMPIFGVLILGIRAGFHEVISITSPTRGVPELQRIIPTDTESKRLNRQSLVPGFNFRSRLSVAPRS